MTIPLPDNEVHVWRASVDDFDLAGLKLQAQPWLSSGEKTRLDRLYFQKHKKQLLLGRVLLRHALSSYEKLAMEQWRLTYNDYGKPRIVDAQQQQFSAPLHFNLSHSQGVLVLAVSRLADIGVDIECNLRARRIKKIASRYFSTTELEHLLALEEAAQQSRFYELWSLKESYIKACGMGLAIDLSHFSFLFGDNHCLSISFHEERVDDPAQWQFWQLRLEEGFDLALAAKSANGQQIQQLRRWNLIGDEVSQAPVEILRESRSPIGNF